MAHKAFVKGDAVEIEHDVGPRFLPRCPSCEEMLQGDDTGGEMLCLNCKAKWYWSVPLGKTKDDRRRGTLTRL